MKDDTTQWVIPAITLGYAVKQDENGRFCFFTDDVEVICRNGVWWGVDDVDPPRMYGNLQSALTSEA